MFEALSGKLGMERKQVIEDEDQFYNLRLLLGDKLRRIEEVELVFVGTGTIGSGMAIALAGNGFRKFTFIDGDKVSMRNIPLCDAFSLLDVGKYKVMVLKNYLERKYGKRVQIKAYPAYVDNIPLEELTSHDMLILGVDNERTKLFVTYHRMRSNKPMAVLGFWGWEASFMLSIPGKTACYACLFRPNSKNEVKKIRKARKCPKPEPNIPGAVIHGTVRRIVGLAANEIAKYFLGEGRIVQYYHFNALSEEEDVHFLDSNYLRPDEKCPFCWQGDEIDAKELKRTGIG